MRLIILPGLGVKRPEDYQALKAYLFGHFQAPPTELISANPEGVDPLVDTLAREFGLPVTRFKIDWQAEPQSTGSQKNTIGDMIVYATEVQGSAAIVVAHTPGELALHARTVGQTYGLPVHLVAVMPTDYDKGPTLIPARDITPQVQRVNEPYIFPQSPSSLAVFETCPRQYEAKYIIKDDPYVQSPEAAYGDEAHHELEAYLNKQGNYTISSTVTTIKGKDYRPSNYKPWADWMLQRAAASGGQVIAERQLGVLADKSPCSYRDKKRWMGGKIDVTILYPATRTAEVFDWKTGKPKDDRTQLQFYGSTILSHHPEVDQVGTGYVWLEAEPALQLSAPVFYLRQDFLSNWETFDHKYQKLKDAYTSGVFPPTPNGLCKQWCNVKRCEFHGKGRR